MIYYGDTIPKYLENLYKRMSTQGLGSINNDSGYSFSNNMQTDIEYRFLNLKDNPTCEELSSYLSKTDENNDFYLFFMDKMMTFTMNRNDKCKEQIEKIFTILSHKSIDSFTIFHHDIGNFSWSSKTNNGIHYFEVNDYLGEGELNLIQRINTAFYLNGKDPEYQLFLSYRRKDSELMENVKKIIEKSKINCFFDIRNAKQNVQQSIEKAIDESVGIVVINSDDYSMSPWCVLEINEARKKRKPIVVLDSSNTKNNLLCHQFGNLAFSRIENGKDGKLTNDANTSVYEAIFNIYQQIIKKNFMDLQSQSNSSISFPYHPTVSDIIDDYENIKKIEYIYYPDPIMFKFDSERINKILEIDNNNNNNTKIELVTLLEGKYIKQKSKLIDKKIQISYSDVDLNKPNNSKTIDFQISNFISLLVRYIYRFGASVLYLGVIKSHSLVSQYRVDMSKILVDYTELYRFENDRRDEVINNKPLLYLSSKMKEKEFENDFDMLKGKLVDSIRFIEADDFSEKGRNSFAEASDVLISIGGKKKKNSAGVTGTSGIFNEFFIYRKKNKPVIPVGRFGGAAKALCDFSKNVVVEKENFEKEYLLLAEYINTESGEYKSILKEYCSGEIGNFWGIPPEAEENLNFLLIGEGSAVEIVDNILQILADL